MLLFSFSKGLQLFWLWMYSWIVISIKLTKNVQKKCAIKIHRVVMLLNKMLTLDIIVVYILRNFESCCLLLDGKFFKNVYESLRLKNDLLYLKKKKENGLLFFLIKIFNFPTIVFVHLFCFFSFSASLIILYIRVHKVFRYFYICSFKFIPVFLASLE